jgi:hypothetical protein
VGIAPDRVVPLAPVERAPLQRIAVGEQYRGLAAVGLYARGVSGKHIRAVEEVGDAAEALRLALRAVDSARQVEAGERLVGLRVAINGGLEREGPRRQVADHQLLVGHLVFAGAQLAPVEAHALELDRLAVEPQGPRLAGVCRIALDLQACAHPRARRVQRHIEVDRVDQVAGRLVVLEQNGSRRLNFHGHSRQGKGMRRPLRVIPFLKQLERHVCGARLARAQGQRHGPGNSALVRPRI